VLFLKTTLIVSPTSARRIGPGKPRYSSCGGRGFSVVNVGDLLFRPVRLHRASTQVVEEYGRPVGTRTPDLYRVKGQLTNTLNNLDRVG